MLSRETGAGADAFKAHGSLAARLHKPFFNPSRFREAYRRTQSTVLYARS